VCVLHILFEPLQEDRDDDRRASEQGDDEVMEENEEDETVSHTPRPDVDKPLNHQNSQGGSRPQSVSTTATSPSVEVNDSVRHSPSKRLLMNMKQEQPKDLVEREMVIHIVRTPGTGLGISIAGGNGSTPYKGSDRVSRFMVLVLARCFELCLMIKNSNLVII